MCSYSFNWSALLLLSGSQSPTKNTAGNSTCSPTPFNIFTRNAKSFKIFYNFLIAASCDLP